MENVGCNGMFFFGSNIGVVGMIFKTLEQKLEDEITLNTITRKLSKSQHDKLLAEQRDIYVIPREKMTFVIAHCIYNEEQNIKAVLEDDLKMNDVDIIHICDGAWEKFEGGHWQSTDKTVGIILEFMEKAKAVGIQVIYEAEPYHNIWQNQGAKRNSQLNMIHARVNPDPHYILVKDGDEFFHFLSGRQNLWLKRDMVEWMKTSVNVGILNTHAFNNDIDMLGARFLPSDVHYSDSKPMVIHDRDHNIVMDYNASNLSINNSRCFKFVSMMLINHWNTRTQDRVFAKVPYLQHQADMVDECNHSNI